MFKKILSLCLIFTSTHLNSYLSTSGNQLINSRGQTIRIKGVSWFGFETHEFVPHGLWIRNYKSMINQIKKLGFNTIRLPYCNEMFNAASKPKSIDYKANPGLRGLTSIQIMDKIIQHADKIGLFIILDHHRSSAGAGPNENGLWYTTNYPKTRFINDWKMLVNRYKKNPSVIGVDLHNEPHDPATWGTNNQNTDWRLAATQIGNIILSINPNLLILVEGIESFKNNFYWWGGNLMGARNAPIKLNRKNKLVYSPHDYPNSVYPQPWFYVPNYPNNLPAKFNQEWGFIYMQKTATIILGEFGSRLIQQKDLQWMSKITSFLNTKNSSNSKGMSWIWWSWNPNSSDTGGILLDDWFTPDPIKMEKLKPLMN